LSHAILFVGRGGRHLGGLRWVVGGKNRVSAEIAFAL
jgi:hypothetical protein